MRHPRLLASAVAILVPLILCAQSGTPVMRTLDKPEALRGDTVTVSGEHLGKEHIAELLLTDGKTDVAVTVLEQTAESIRFQVKPETKCARYGLLILTKGESPLYIEQPIKLSVVEALSPKKQEAPPAEEPPPPAPNR